MSNLTPEQEQAIGDFVKRLSAFSSGTSHNCPSCGKEVTSATFYEGIEEGTGSLYVHPCDCRLGRWEHAPKWIANVEVVPFEWEEDEEDDEFYEDGETFPCGCPYCHCMNQTTAGEVCSDCLAGSHQG